MSYLRTIPLVMLLAAVLAAPSAGVELVLQNDELLVGESVERDEAYYLLTLASGEVVTLPVSLVREVRLFQGELRDDEDTVLSPFREPGFIVGRAGDVGPNASPESLPKVADQLEVFGEPRGWRRAPVDPFWMPDSDWSNDLSQNDFAPARWSESSYDFNWTPGGEFNDRPEALNQSRSRWRRWITDPYWVPRDGFGSSFSVFD